MRQYALFAVAFAVFFTTAIAPARAGAAGSGPRVLIAPFDNRSGQASQNYLSLALAATLAEKLENESGLRILNGPLVLTEEQARLFSGVDDLAAANDLARNRGADLLVTGRFSGKTWDWFLTVEIYAVTDQGPVLTGLGEAKGSQMSPVRRADGKKVQVANMSNLAALLAAAADAAFAAADLALSTETLAELGRPQTGDAYAYQILARAGDRYFGTGRVRTKDTALEIAEHAVLIDPSCVAAQRFYAFLLTENGLPKKARLHYEQVLAKEPDDFRTLAALGRLELEQDDADSARDHLLRAVRLRPDDAVSRYWLARAWLRLGDRERAIADLETARNGGDAPAEARRTLAELYAADRRYGDAAGEYAALVAADNCDPDAAFELAACLRADGRLDETAQAYARATQRFPNEPRLFKFLGDVLTETGDLAGAAAAYRRARDLDPRDPRSAALTGGSDRDGGIKTPPGALVSVIGLAGRIADAGTLMRLIDDARGQFRDAANDAAMELMLRGRQACAERGAAAAAAALARESGRSYAGLLAELRLAAAALAFAADHGEKAGLTPDERQQLDQIVAGAKEAGNDLAEMEAQYRAALLPWLKQDGCPADAAPAAIADVRRRNGDRRVALPEVQPPQYLSPISPQIAPRQARLVMFTVDNTAGSAEYALVVDGDELGHVRPGRSDIFAASVGTHALCLLPPGKKCGDPGTLRRAFLHDGWTVVIRPAE